MSQGFYCCAETPLPKTAWEGKGLLYLNTFTIKSNLPSAKEVRAETQGGDPEARADAKTMEGASYCLALRGLLNLLSYSIQGHQPGVAPPIMSWAHIDH